MGMSIVKITCDILVGEVRILSWLNSTTNISGVRNQVEAYTI